jgi:purine nucleosidase/pyrimidine-specific ribonucleoside hydrolase
MTKSREVLNPVWDLVAAINLGEPNFSEEIPLRLEVDTSSDPGGTQGQTRAIAGNPNVFVSSDPSFTALPFTSARLFSSFPTVPEPAPLVGWLGVGFLGSGLGLARRA